MLKTLLKDWLEVTKLEDGVYLTQPKKDSKDSGKMLFWIMVKLHNPITLRDWDGKDCPYMAKRVCIETTQELFVNPWLTLQSLKTEALNYSGYDTEWDGVGFNPDISLSKQTSQINSFDPKLSTDVKFP